MDAQFWIKAWDDGRTNFHRNSFNEKLLEYFPTLGAEEGQKVLVPLCGKSKDLIWLQSLNLKVHGVELYIKAVEEFFTDNKLSPVNKTVDPDFSHFTYKNITLSCGDFFKLNESETYDFIYDRASLVALPGEMRKTYAEVLTKALKPGGKYLLIVYEYDQTKMEGPPFSVTTSEIHSLYDKNFNIKMVESESPQNEGARLSEVINLQQKIYILEKKH